MRILINPVVFKQLSPQPLQMLGECLVIETAFPPDSRPAKASRTLSTKRRALTNTHRVSYESDKGGVLRISVNGFPPDEGDCIGPEDYLKRLEQNGYGIDRDAVVCTIRGTVRPSASRAEPKATKPESPGAPDEDEIIAEIIASRSMVGELLKMLSDKAERSFVCSRVLKYQSDYPELQEAGDEPQVFAIISSELDMYRAQRSAITGEGSGKIDLTATQKVINDAQKSLGITREQRLKRGDTGRSTLADLVKEYDSMQRERLKQFERDMEEEAATLEVAEARKQRDLQPGSAEVVLRREFQIEVDPNEHKLKFIDEAGEQADGGNIDGSSESAGGDIRETAGEVQAGETEQPES